MKHRCQAGHDSATRSIRAQSTIIFRTAAAAGDLDPDAIHDMRVASRRLRTAIKVYRPYLQKNARKRFCRDAKRITALLGNRRELDVMVAMLREHRDETRALWQRFMDHAIAILDRRRETQAGYCLEAVQLAESDAFAETLERVLDGVDAAGVCVYDLARAELFAAHDKARRARKYWMETGDLAALHQVRIELKHLRYTGEFHLPLFGEPLKDYVARVKECQTILGEWNECRLLEDMVITLGNAADYTLAQGAPLVAEAYGNRAGELAEQFGAPGKALLGKRGREKLEAALVDRPACCPADA